MVEINFFVCLFFGSCFYNFVTFPFKKFFVWIRSSVENCWFFLIQLYNFYFSTNNPLSTNVLFLFSFVTDWNDIRNGVLRRRVTDENPFFGPLECSVWVKWTVSGSVNYKMMHLSDSNLPSSSIWGGVRKFTVLKWSVFINRSKTYTFTSRRTENNVIFTQGMI